MTPLMIGEESFYPGCFSGVPVPNTHNAALSNLMLLLAAPDHQLNKLRLLIILTKTW